MTKVSEASPYLDEKDVEKFLDAIDQIVNRRDWQYARWICQTASEECPKSTEAIKTCPIDSGAPLEFYEGYLKGIQATIIACRMRRKTDPMIVMVYLAVLQRLLKATERIQ